MAGTSIMKHLQRVRMNIDQSLARTERSNVLNVDERDLEERVELLKTICQNFYKKVLAFLKSPGPTTDVEKRLKKLPESALSGCLSEAASRFGLDTGSGQVFQMAGDAENALAAIVLGMETEIEMKIIAPVRDMVEVDYPSVLKLKKQLNSRILDVDSAKSRYNSAQKQVQAGVEKVKLDEAKNEVDEAQAKMEQTKDQLATEMYNFVGKESDLNRCLQELARIQADYHRQSLGILERLVPQIQENIEFIIKKPLFGQSLQEHLDSEGRDIAYVLEECIAVLHEFALQEEGLFRIAGSSSKIKKLKSAFNSSHRPVIASVEDIDLHVIASVLKLYLRELPEPLMCSDLYNDWFHVLHKPAEQRLPSLRDVVNKLPKMNYSNLRFLIKFLAKLAEYADVNKMSASNISLVLAPNLLWPAGESGPNMLTTGLQSSIVEILIANANYFFPENIDFSSGKAPLGTPTRPDANFSSSAQQPSIGLGSITSSLLTGIISPEITSDSSSASASPGTLKRGPKKPPAPLPPPDKLSPADTGSMNPVLVKSLSAGAPVTGSSGSNGNPTARMSVPESALTDGSLSPRPERPSSPTARQDRPKYPPPERPQMPPPEKPTFTDKPPVLKEKPGSRATSFLGAPISEKPNTTTRPALSADMESTKLYPSLSDVEKDLKATDASQASTQKTHIRQSSYGGMGPRPPRPQPPPPPATRP